MSEQTHPSDAFLSLPTRQKDAFGLHFLSYVQPSAVIGIVPILDHQNGCCVESGSRLLLVSREVIETHWKPSTVADAIRAALQDIRNEQ